MENFKPFKRWIHQQDEYIKTEFSDRPTADLAEKCDVNYYTVSRRATRLGVSKSLDFMHASWKKRTRKVYFVNPSLKDAKKKYLQEHFADTSNAELAALFGVDVKTIRRWAKKLGLVKSDEFMFSVRSKGRRGKNFYTDKQIAWRNHRIAEAYPDADIEELNQLADELGIALSTLRYIAHKIGARRSREGIRKSHIRSSAATTKYGPDVIEAIRAYFPYHTDGECATYFGISESVIKALARRNGMRKSKEHLSRIRRELRKQQNKTK